MPDLTIYHAFCTFALKYGRRNHDKMSSAMEGFDIFLLLLIGIAIVLVLWLYIFLPVSMARKRGRSGLGWMLLFWILTPFWGIIVLLIAGDSTKKILNDFNKQQH